MAKNKKSNDITDVMENDGNIEYNDNSDEMAEASEDIADVYDETSEDAEGTYDEKASEDAEEGTYDDEASENAEDTYDDVMSEDVYEDAGYSDENEDDYDEYYEDGVEDYIDDTHTKRKPSQLDILDDEYIKDNMMHKAGLKTVLLVVTWIVFAALVMSYVYFLFIKKDKADFVPGRDNSVVLEIPDDANYRKCDIDDINQLINNYLIARINCNQETLKSLVTDPTQFDDMTLINQAAEYIKGYSDTECYIVDGYDSDSYIVIELSYLKISGVESKPIDVMSFYVVKGEDGRYKIDNSTLSPEAQKYITDIKSTDDIQKIYIHVKENVEYYRNNDASFAEFYNLINGGGDKEQK